MLFFMSNDGTITSSLPNIVNQGSSNANVLYVVAALSNVTQATVSFQLANGAILSPALMTYVQEIPGLTDTDGNIYSGWEYTLPGEVTQYYGTTKAQFFFYTATAVLASTMTAFTVTAGVPNSDLPDEPSADIYEQILQNLSALQADVTNGYYSSRAIYAWNSAFTYNINEITYYPIGQFGAFVKSVQSSNTNNTPYINGAVNTEWWTEVINFNNISEDYFQQLSELASQAADSAAQAQETANNLANYFNRTIQLVPALPPIEEASENVIYAVVTNADANIFTLYAAQDGQWVNLGNANFTSNTTATVNATLTVSGWSNNTQTVLIDNISASDSVQVTPLDASADTYITSGVTATQVTGGVQFTCTTTPTEAINVTIEVTGYAEIPSTAGYYTKPQTDNLLAAKQNITDNTLITTAKTIPSAINENTTAIAGLQQDVINTAHFKGFATTAADVQSTPADANDYMYCIATGTIWTYNNGWTNSNEPYPSDATPLSTTTPLQDGTATAGTATSAARGDHVHPTDTSRASAADLSAETSAREQADTTLQNNIDSEATARQNADTSLESSINAEEQAREQAISAVNSAISAETAAREQADNGLGARITEIIDGTTPAGKVNNALTITVNGVPQTYDGSAPINISLDASNVSISSANVSIPTTSWASNTATVNVTGVGANSIINFIPNPEAITYGVTVTGQGTGTVTFTCTTTPTEAITGNLVIFNGG